MRFLIGWGTLRCWCIWVCGVDGRRCWPLLQGMSSLLGWALVAALGEHGGRDVAWLLPVSAGSFLYISLVDLLPELGSERKRGGGDVAAAVSGLRSGTRDRLDANSWSVKRRMRIGVDLGGTKIEAIALDSKGRELRRVRGGDSAWRL